MQVSKRWQPLSALFLGTENFSGQSAICDAKRITALRRKQAFQ